MKVNPGIVALIVLLVALVILVVTNLERVETVVHIPPGPEARENKLLAAERFFTEMGLPAEGVDDLDELPPTDHIVVLAMEPRITNIAEVDRLLQWLDVGGMLILTPPVEDGRAFLDPNLDPLLGALEVGFVSYDGVPSRVVEEMQLGDEEPAEVLFYDTLGLDFHDDTEVNDSYSLLWNEYGNGTYVVACDLGFLHNGELEQHDHALFAWRLTELGGERAGILLVRGQRDVSLLGLLARAGWLAMVIGSACLFVWAWRSAMSFGPLIPEPEPASRSIMEHVEAAGRYLWQHGRHDALLAPTRTSLLQQLVLRRPAMAGLDEDGQCRALSRGTSLGTEEIRLALFEACPHKRDDYTERMRVLEKLRRGL